ncbi:MULTISPECIES: substrate-binding periplasmic protein [Vibrio]|uniref:substrate-binding periplasmic protein n=1 Tax=Vibrio TaxID=662 RepID=UPI00207523C8|nr:MULTISPECIES: transporter substrate-binding domain-containing protein [Vibrio]USD31319.1 transporter substrate-binding domain-containing protein [Vibrio sp. SCSIO 43186]USD44364.1 transporter substrate-binding domain-containing protein [Vibrio sp. SCSIO 43145]USD68442.1 transporter substrate-binding domain-containing protein [Vibrio sp. SCSIO 43139]USD96128.1 amino acid ABC transporter substrate-binding protein [Vibrio coralliilyticus]
MKYILSLSLSLFVFSLPIGAVELDELVFLTEEYPPYNFTQDGEAKGISIDLLIAAAQSQGVEINKEEIKVQPWARAYRTALIKPNAVLFATTRTRLREHLFQWVGPLSTTRIVVMAKKSRNISIENAMDFAQYRIGVIRDDVGEQLMLELGVPRDSMQENSVAETLAKQLAKGRIDLWAYEENVAKWWLKKIGQDTDDYEPVFVLSEGELYYAFNLAVDEKLTEKLQRGIDQMKKTINEASISRYQEIVEIYR